MIGRKAMLFAFALWAVWLNGSVIYIHPAVMQSNMISYMVFVNFAVVIMSGLTILAASVLSKWWGWVHHINKPEI